MTIHIDNPEIERFFVSEFKSDAKKFTDFILTNLERYRKTNEFDITPLDPHKNSYRLEYDTAEEIDESANPFRDIENAAEYARALRENAWR
jgi:hypothetical protein